MLHLIKDEICNVTGGRNVAVAAVNTPAQKQKLRISQDQKGKAERAVRVSSGSSSIHSFMTGRKVCLDIPPACSKGQKVGELSGNEETMEVKKSYIVNAKCLIKVEDYDVIFKDIDAFQLN